MIKLESGVLFDFDFYSLESGEAFATADEALKHFVEIGQELGYNPSPFFMWSWVRAQSASLGLDRYFAQGLAIPPHPLLQVSRIENIAREPDWVGPFRDWIRNSELHELVPEAFLPHEVSSLDAYDFFRAVTSRHSRRPLESELFSSQWYNIAYRDVAEAQQNPFIHYVTDGWKEARDPSPRFSTKLYLQHNRDVREHDSNPLLHYANFGRGEGRAASPTTSYELAVRYQSLTNTGPKPYVAFDGPVDLSLDDLSYRENKKLVIVIPFYKREDLVETVLNSLIRCADELRRIGVVVVLVNDSPDYPLLDAAISSWFSALDRESLDTVYLCNSKNSGFVYSSNCGIWIAERLGANCLLLNSDTVVYPGAITEMLAVLETDEKFGFVNPRTNNATIATYGATPSAPAEGYALFGSTHGLLPRYQIVPVVVGFCLLIRAEVVRFFGYLDSVYGMGYNEENDYIMRANRRGFSSVLANHAFVAHLGKASFSVLCDNPDDAHYKNEAVFLQRYPEFKPAILRYFASPKYHAHRLIEQHSGVDVLFDIRTALMVKNGTSRLICALLPFLVRQLIGLKLAVAADPEVLAFLEIDLPESVRVIANDQEAANVKAGVGFLFSQPFSAIAFDRLAYVSEKVGVFLLDAIAADCLYIQSDGLVRLWERVCRSGDLFVFNSDYTKERFVRRYDFAADALLLASTHSVDPSEYLQGQASDAGRLRDGETNRTSVLVFGNHFEHKGLVPALEALAGHDFDLVVFGVELPRRDVRSIAGGQLPDDELIGVLTSCDVFVFPSFYEGFGFPILEAVAQRKPIVLLNSELNRSLYRRLGEPESFFFFEDFRQLEGVVRQAVAFDGPWPDNRAMSGDGWRRSAVEIAGGIRETLSRTSNFGKIEQRLAAIP